MVSAVVLTKNESNNIVRCLRSLQWCDEIIIVDDYSTDSTLTKAKRFTKKIFIHELEGDFAQQRNYGLEKTAGEWVFFVDADEEVSLSLQYELTSIVVNQFSEFDGYYIKRIDQIWNKKILHGEAGNSIFLRFAKKEKGLWEGRVHETWKKKGKTGCLKNPLYHYPHPNISSFLQEINFYSTLRAQELYEKKTQVRIWQILLYPKAKFFLNYILRLGFLDGVPGLVIALMMSFHSFLVRGKLWYSNKNE